MHTRLAAVEPSAADCACGSLRFRSAYTNRERRRRGDGSGRRARLAIGADLDQWPTSAQRRAQHTQKSACESDGSRSKLVRRETKNTTYTHSTTRARKRASARPRGPPLSLSATHPLSYHTAQYVIATCSAGPIGSSAQAHHHLDRSTITQPHTRPPPPCHHPHHITQHAALR